MNIFSYIMDLVTWSTPFKPVKVEQTAKVLQYKSIHGGIVYVVHKRAHPFRGPLSKQGLINMAKRRGYFDSTKIHEADINFKIKPKVHYVKL